MEGSSSLMILFHHQVLYRQTRSNLLDSNGAESARNSWPAQHRQRQSLRNAKSPRGLLSPPAQNYKKPTYDNGKTFVLAWTGQLKTFVIFVTSDAGGMCYEKRFYLE
jgi:hypothetical protein